MDAEAPPAYGEAAARDSESPIDELLRKAQLTDNLLGHGLSHLTRATLRLPRLLQRFEGEVITIALKEILIGVNTADFQLNFSATDVVTLSNAVDAMEKVRRMMDLSPMGSRDYETLIWGMIENLSILVIHPRILEEVAKRAFYGEGEDDKKKLFKNNLLFTFALRNILSKVAFHTILRVAVLKALDNAMNRKGYRMKKGKKGEKDKNLDDAIAFVGFNRLMSPNNAHGASISSDIDFKMVFDLTVIEQDLILSGEIYPFQVKELVKILNQVLEDYTKQFDVGRLTLEVMGFTTKALSDVADSLEKEVAERNFYASMFYNQAFIAGSHDLYVKFIEVIQKYINDKKHFLIAKSAYNQYLADTDKGSIKVIEHLNYLKDVVDACGRPLRMHLGGSNPERSDPKKVLNAFLKFTGFTEFQWQSMATDLQDAWITSPLVFYKVINNDHIKDFLISKDVQDKEMIEKLPSLKISQEQVFPSLKISQEQVFQSIKIRKDEEATNRVVLLKRVAQVVKGLADKEVLDFSTDEERQRKDANYRAWQENRWNKNSPERQEEKEKPPPHPRFAANAYYQCGSSLSIPKPDSCGSISNTLGVV